MPGKVNAGCPGLFKVLGDIGGHVGILRVRSANHRDFGATFAKCLGSITGIGKAVIGDCLNPASFEKVSGKHGARGVLGNRAQIGQKDLRKFAG